MIFLLDFCSLPWLLPWLLPFLLGLLLGWLVWGRYRRLLAQSEADLKACRKHSAGLEEDLAECRKSYNTLVNENATLRGKIRELETDLSTKNDLLDTFQEGEGADIGTLNIIEQDSLIDVPDVDTSQGIGDADDASVDVPDMDVASGVTGFTGGDVSGQDTSDSSVKIGSGNMYAALKEDNLQIVEGIGPKMESVMKDNGISTWAEMAAKSSDEIKAILSSEKYGRRYQIIDPTTWPEQATLARDGKWEELIALQKALDAGRSNAVSITDSKVEKLLIKMGVMRKFDRDDLKVVEGIGPKIAELMKNNGIDTWAKLAASSSERLQGILDSAGDRFKLADPGTWPKQSRLADEGKWDELQEYQDFLQGGRE